METLLLETDIVRADGYAHLRETKEPPSDSLGCTALGSVPSSVPTSNVPEIPTLEKRGRKTRSLPLAWPHRELLLDQPGLHSKALSQNNNNQTKPKTKT